MARSVWRRRASSIWLGDKLHWMGFGVRQSGCGQPAFCSLLIARLPPRCDDQSCTPVNHWRVRTLRIAPPTTRNAASSASVTLIEHPVRQTGNKAILLRLIILVLDSFVNYRSSTDQGGEKLGRNDCLVRGSCGTCRIPSGRAGTNGPDETRCPQFVADVTSASSEEHLLICAAVKHVAEHSSIGPGAMTVGH